MLQIPFEQFYQIHVDFVNEEINRLKNKINNLLDRYNNGEIAEVPAKALFNYLVDKLVSFEEYLETL